MIVFSKEWFDEYQEKLLKFANSKWGRYVLRIHGDRSNVGKNKITNIQPNSITWLENNKFKTEFRTHAKYSKRLYHAFKYLWFIAHAWDMAVANKLNVALNVGFDTLITYTRTSVNTIDYQVAHDSAGTTWSNLRGFSGSSSSPGGSDFRAIEIISHSVSNQWLTIGRSGYNFDTSSISSNYSVDSVTLSLRGSAKSDGLAITPDVNIYDAFPASTSTVATSDYSKFGTTAFSTTISYANFSTSSYNNFELNASGISNINLGGISSFGVRNAGYDVANVAPTWSASQTSYIRVNGGSYTGTSRDPMLLVTYSPLVVAYYSASNPYADGKLMRNTGSGWSNVTSGDLRFITYTEDGDTTVPQLSVDPSDILRDALDFFADNGGTLTYNDASIQDTGTTVSYTFVSQTLLEVINKCVELAPYNWYWYIDPATNIVYFREKDSYANHTLTLGKHFKSLEVEKRSDEIINTVYFTGGDTGGGVILYKKYQNSDSVSFYGLRSTRYIDERVTVAGTAQLLANNLINAKNAPELRMYFELSDSNLSELGYDIESINVGDIINVRNIKNSDGSSLWDVMLWDVDYWDFNVQQISTMYLQVIRKEYQSDGLRAYCSSVPPDINKRIEDIKRNLENSLTANNPDVPT
jgi:hypothetical protein